MASLRYRIGGSGIRGFSSTKDAWEVKRNEVMNVKLERGCLLVYTKQNVCAGSIPQEFQEVLRSFMSSKTSSVSIEVKVTSVKPVSRVKNKGQEIPCDIELIGEDAIAVRNDIQAVGEEIKYLKKQQPELSFKKMPSNTSTGQTKLGATDKKIKKQKTKRKDISVRKMSSNGKNSSNNNKKRKRTLDNNSMTGGPGPKKRKMEASTSAAQKKLGATAKQQFTIQYQESTSITIISK